MNAILFKNDNIKIKMSNIIIEKKIKIYYIIIVIYKDIKKIIFIFYIKLIKIF